MISFGHRESVTLSQIKTYTEMDSHEEKLHQMIEQSKINEAREIAKKKQMEAEEGLKKAERTIATASTFYKSQKFVNVAFGNDMKDTWFGAKKPGLLEKNSCVTTVSPSITYGRFM